MRKNFGDPPEPPKKANLGRTKAEMGCLSQKGLCYSFGILHGLLSHKIRKIPTEKNVGDPPSSLKKPILGGQTLKLGMSPRRVFGTVLKFCMGS